MEPLVVLVLEGEYRLTAAVLFCLSLRKNVVIHMVSRDTTSPFRYSRYVSSHHCQESSAFGADFLAFVKLVAGHTRAQVLLPVDVEGMRFAITNRAALETGLRVLPLPSATAYEVAADKSLLAAFMYQHGVPGPHTLTNIRHNLADQLKHLRFPVLLKPTDGAGGQGIVLFQEASELLAHVATLPPDGNFIVQTYLKGYDIDCNVLCREGQVLTHSIQRGLLSSASTYAPTQAIEFVQDRAVLAVVSQLMAALNWSGVAHLDLRYDSATQEVNVIEINPRFWLTVVGSAVKAKVNFPVLASLAALGRPMEQEPFALGRYIPFVNFLKYKYAWRAKNKIPFTFSDTSWLGFLGDPLPKIICLLYPSRVRIE